MAAMPGVGDKLARAFASHRAGRLAEAERLYRETLAADPANAGGLHGLGILALQAGFADRAADLLGRAAAVAPADPALLNNLGIALAKCGRVAEARARFEQAVSLAPRFADALVNLAGLLVDLGERPLAQRTLEAAIAASPDSAEALAQLGRLLLADRRPAEAEARLREAAARHPAHAGIANLLGNALREQGRIAEAISMYRESQRLRPDHPEAWSNWLVAINSDPSVSAAEAFAAHRAFGERFGPAFASSPPFPPRRPGRVRIGYVSADFKAHAVAAFIEPVLAQHDRDRFEVTAYSGVVVEDATTVRLRGLVEHFIPIVSLTDAQFAQRVREDAIDVLVDLSGHTSGHRLLAFARRAAPVQVTWLGYPNTTGLASMDYRLTDERADPPGVAEALHTERLLRVAPSAWCYRPWDCAPEVGGREARAGEIVFGAMNNPAKLNERVIGTWTRVLACVPGSRLVMHAPDDEGLRHRVSAAMAGADVAPQRLSFFPRLSTADYLSRYSEIDIALDPFPCAGATTTFDALWMGVPVLTLAGDRPYSRSGASILGALGLEAWVAMDADDYVARAVRHASDPALLRTLRRTLRGRLRASPVTDGAALAREVERAFVAACRQSRLDVPEAS